MSELLKADVEEGTCFVTQAGARVSRVTIPDWRETRTRRAGGPKTALTRRAPHLAQVSRARTVSLIAFAESGRQGAPMYDGILRAYDLGEVDSEPVFPDMTRAMQQPMSRASAPTVITALRAYPDPADSETMLVFPVDWRGRTLTITDAQGRERSQTLLISPGVQTLSTTPLAAGVYHLQVSGSSEVCRLVVKH